MANSSESAELKKQEATNCRREEDYDVILIRDRKIGIIYFIINYKL